MRTERGGSEAVVGLARRAARGSLWSILATAVSLPLNLVTGIVVARVLGPADFGQLVVLTTFVQVVLPFLDFGFGSALLQWAGAAAGRGDVRSVTKLLRQNFGLQLALPMPLTLLVGIVALHRSTWLLQVIYLLFVLVSALIAPAVVRLVVENKTALTAKVGLAAGVASSLSAMSLAVAGAGPAAIWVGRSAASVLPALFVIAVLRPSGRPAFFSPALPRGMPPTFWLFARGSWIAAGLGALVGNRSEAFVLTWNGLPVAVGVFSVAYGLASQITAPLDLLQANLGPAMSALAGRDAHALREALKRALPLFGLGSCLVLVVSPAMVALVPVVYGDEYRAATGPLVPLLLASCLQTALAPFAVMAVVRRRRRLLPVVQALTAAADLGLAALLVPLLGVAGAVTGATVGLVLGNVALAHAEERSVSSLVRVVVGSCYLEACAAFACGVLAVRYVGPPVAAAAGGAALSLAVFLLLVLALRRRVLAQMLSELHSLLPAGALTSTVERLGRILGPRFLAVAGDDRREAGTGS